MSLRRHWLALVLLCLAVLPVAVLAHQLTLARITDVTLDDGDGVAIPVEFPYSADARTDRAMSFAFHVRATSLTQKSFIVLPDDHLLSVSVNGVDESLASIDPKKLDDFVEGVRFSLGEHFKEGDNRVVVRVLNRGGGQGGLDVRPDPRDRQNALEIAVAAGACLLLLGATLRRAGAGWTLTAMAVAAAGLRLGCWWKTPYLVRHHDVPEHLKYIQYLLDHHALPKAAEGYAFYHPPLYYLLSALTWRTLAALGLAKDVIFACLQLQSLVFELGYAAFSIATARLWLDRVPDSAFGRGLSSRSGLMALIAALILVWPSSVIHSVRIGNDDLTYLFFSAALYFASRYWLLAGARNANLAALSGALAILTKTNGVIIFPVLVVMLAVRLWQRRRAREPILARQVLRRSLPALALAVGSSVLAIGRGLIDTIAGRQGHVLIANASLNPGDLLVGNRAENYMWFDLHAFVTQAFSSPWDDAQGRQFFWNYLLKTGLFGEFEFGHVWAWSLAVVLSVSFLGMCVHAMIGTLRRSPAEWLEELPLFLLAVFLVASLAALRITLPFSCSGDFRYVLPILMPCIWWYVRSLAAYRQRGGSKVAGFGLALGWLFVGLSAAFIVVIVVTAP